MSNNRNDSSRIADVLNNTSNFLPLSPEIRNATFVIEDEIDIDLDDELGIDNENENLKRTITYMLKNYPKDIICKKIIGNKCSICLEEFKFSDKLLFTSCYHIFHKECLDKSIDTGIYNCPKCRFEISSGGFMNIEMNIELKGVEFY